MEINFNDIISYLVRYIILCFISVFIIVFVVQDIRKELYKNILNNRNKVIYFIRYESLIFNLFQNKYGYILFIICIFLITPSLIILIMYIIDKIKISYIVYNYFK